MTDYRTYRPDRAEKAMILMLSALALLFTGILFYDTPWTIVLFPAAYLPAMRVYSAFMAERRKGRLRRQFRDLLDSLSASFAGGRHMKEALSEAEKELSGIYEEDDEISEEIRMMLRRMEDGETDEEVLRSFAVRTGIEDIEVFSQVYSTCRETGGDIITAMMDASSMLGEKIKIENEIRALTAQKKTEGMVISVMPVIIIVFLRIIAPDYIAVLYGSPAGIVIMTGALAATGASYYMIHRITAVEI